MLFCGRNFLVIRGTLRYGVVILVGFRIFGGLLENLLIHIPWKLNNCELNWNFALQYYPTRGELEYSYIPAVCSVSQSHFCWQQIW